MHDCCSGHSRQDDQYKPDKETGKHRGDQTRGTSGRGAEFLPDENAPQGGDHGRALAQAVGNGEAGATRGDDVERHANAPDESTQDAGKVRADAASEIIRVGDGRSYERLPHKECVDDEVAEEDADGKNKYGPIWTELSFFGARKIWIHRGGDKMVEKSHQHAAGNR